MQIIVHFFLESSRSASNTFYRRRPSTYSLGRPNNGLSGRRFTTEHAELLKYVAADGDTDQVAKSSVYTSHFNHLNDRLSLDDLTIDTRPVEQVVFAVKPLILNSPITVTTSSLLNTKETVELPASASGSQVSTRRMDMVEAITTDESMSPITTNLPITTTTTTATTIEENNSKKSKFS